MDKEKGPQEKPRGTVAARAMCMGGMLPATLCRRLSTSTFKGPPSFVFDIDGVLIRGKNVLQPAKRALQRLYESGGQRPRYPVCFLTNGGGCTEDAKGKQLTEWLGVRVTSDQVVLSHTPFQSLVKQWGDRPVVLSGRGQTRHVAEIYGFNQTATTDDLARAFPNALPFKAKIPDAEHGVKCPVRDEGMGTDQRPFEAVLVFSDPADWYQDLQLLTDVLVSGGVPTNPMQQPGRPPLPIYFSNPDKLWSNEFPTPRLGQGSFAAALNAVHIQASGQPIARKHFFGKPNPAPYHLILEMLKKQADLLGLGAEPAGPVYAIGDNPQSDIAGARAMGAPWVPVLVRTGVFNGPEMNDKQHPADIVCDHVEDAVNAAMHRLRSTKWHSMR